MIRCDDIFVDSDAYHLERICRIIRKYDFCHLIGITFMGEGRRIWNRDKSKLPKIPLPRFFDNYRDRRITGEKFIGDNVQLLKTLNAEFDENGAIPALHGLHHYHYNQLTPNKVRKELSEGIDLFNTLFNLRVKVFTPPFNAWNRRTELICENLGLTLDKCLVGFGLGLDEMKNSQIIQMAKEQSSVREVNYHPYHISNLEKFELYLKTRRKYGQF